MMIARRDVIAAVPAIGVAGLLAGCAPGTSGVASAGNIYRVDDEATILAAARAIIAEDPVAALITLDAEGVPRARSVGVSDPEDDLTLWIGTRRTSRKVAQLRGNPRATLYFNRDNVSENYAGAYYASFMGIATVHFDDATLQARRPDPETQRGFWPNFPHDFAAIRFRPHWLEVAGHGINGDTANWQPQAVILRR